MEKTIQAYNQLTRKYQKLVERSLHLLGKSLSTPNLEGIERIVHHEWLCIIKFEWYSNSTKVFKNLVVQEKVKTEVPQVTLGSWTVHLTTPLLYLTQK